MNAENQNSITVTVFFKTGFIFFGKFYVFLLISYIFIYKKSIFHRKDLKFETNNALICFNKVPKLDKEISKTF